MSTNKENINTLASRAKALIDYEKERFDIQKQFAEFLCRQNKSKAAAWKRLISKACAIAEKAFSSGSPDAIKEAVREAEKIMMPISSAAKSYTIRCAGHAHIDMNWMWSWPETVNTTNDSLTTVLRLMEEFPEFKFSQSQASIYRIVELFNPEMLKQIKKRVKSGQWEVTASHWVEGDKNIAGAEALCRHLLYTRNYLQKLIDLSPEDVEIDWTPDTFGHAHTVPSYLVRGGVKYTYLHRPGVHTPPQPRPRVFRWKAPDGSEVLVKNDMHNGYNGQISPTMATWVLIPEVEETGLKTALFVYGVGDHGGGPTRRDLVTLRDLMSWPIYPAVIPSTVRDYFKEIEKEKSKLPVVDNELNFEFTGCYTTQTVIKKANRYSEKKLADAESIAALTWAGMGRKYDNSGFETKWRDTLFAHFHDILPGSGVHDTRTYTHGMFQEIMAFTSMQEAEALRALAAQVDTSYAAVDVPKDMIPGRIERAMGAGMGHETQDGGLTQYAYGKGSDRRAFLVYNPLPYMRDEIVEVTVWDPGCGWEDRDMVKQAWRVKCPDGTYKKVQVLYPSGGWGHNHLKMAFPVSVPANGYSLYIIEEGKTDEPEGKAGLGGIQHQCGYAWYERGPEGLNNGLTRVKLNMEDGGIDELEDLVNKTFLVTPDKHAPVLQYGVERPKGMSAWTIEHTNGWSGIQVKSIKRGYNGPYIASMDVEGDIGNSTFKVTYMLRANDPSLYISINGTWFEKGDGRTGSPVLRFNMPLNIDNVKGTYEIPFGAIDRVMEHGEEVPALRWAAAAGEKGKKKAGVLLLNESKHGYSIEGSDLNMTLIRSSYDPDPLPEVGQHKIDLAIQPTAGKPGVLEATAAGRTFNHELKIINTDAHKGTLKAEGQFIAVTPSCAVLETVKKSETEDALILRLYNPTEQKCEAKVKLDSKLVGKAAKAVETDLLERPLKKNGAKVSGNTVSVGIAKRGIVTLKITLK